MERIPWEGQNFSEVVAPKEEEEEEGMFKIFNRRSHCMHPSSGLESQVLPEGKLHIP
jgi:hypothetical protein